MNTKRIRLIAGVLSAMVLSAPLAMALAPNLVFTNLRGTLRVHQNVPCGDAVDRTTSIADGRIELMPSQARVEGDVLGNVLFYLTRADLFFTPFSVPVMCLGAHARAEFSEVGVQLASPVRFTGEPIGDGRYRFSIPRRQFTIYESVVDNGPVQQPVTRYVRPSEDVTGLIDLVHGIVELHVVLTSRMRLRGERFVGTQTVDITGVLRLPGTDTDRDGVPDLSDNCPLLENPSQAPVATPVITAPPTAMLDSCRAHDIDLAEASDVCHARPVRFTSSVPVRFETGRNVVTWSATDGIDPLVTAQTVVRVTDRTPPAVSCTAVPATTAGLFQVSAADDCAGRTNLRLGTFPLGDGEVIRITETTRPGVRLVGGGGGVRQFQVGPGDAVIRATDAAGNHASVACR